MNSMSAVVKRLLTALVVVAVLGVTACSNRKEPEQKDQKKITNREKAKTVGRFSDSIMTENLEKNLVNVVDLAEERARKLEKMVEEE